MQVSFVGGDFAGGDSVGGDSLSHLISTVWDTFPRTKF